MSGTDRWAVFTARAAEAGERLRVTATAVTAAVREANTPVVEKPKTAGEYAAEADESHVLYYPAPDVASAADALARVAADYHERADAAAGDVEVVFRLTSSDMYRLKANVVEEAVEKVRGGPRRSQAKSSAVCDTASRYSG